MIDGVKIINIKSNVDNRGYFREIFRPDEIGRTKSIKQISHSFIKKGVIKAWHVHKKQHQWNYLLKGRIKVSLFDLRKKSKTFKKIHSFELIGDKSKIAYFFPPGIAHGYITKNSENHMIYGTSGYYDITEEYKIQPTKFEILNYFK